MILDAIKNFYSGVLPDCLEFYQRAPLNEFWSSSNLREMRSIINSAQTLEDVIHGAQRTLMFSVNVPDASKEWAVRWLLDERKYRLGELLEPKLFEDVQESPHSYPGNNVHINDKIYTPDLLRCVNIAAEIQNGCGGSPMSVVELGGGLGHLARVLAETNVARFHVIVDLPETLVFSYCFLRANYPELNAIVIGKDSEIDLEYYADTGAFVFVPVAYAEKLVGYPFDLFLNTASMGEMRNETIRHWMTWVNERLKLGHLFTLNRFLNTITPSLSWRRLENECQQYYGPDWSILDWQLEPRYTRCPYVDTRISRYVQIIARRGPVVSRPKLPSIVMEDWWQLRDQGHVMGMRDNPLSIDLGMDGTLFKLWELARLAPSRQVVEMMIVYLDRLHRRGGEEFEERSFYVNWLRRLQLQGG